MAARSIINDSAFRKARERRFWKSVDTSGGYDACWPWLGSLLPGGYGSVSFLGRRTTAQRIAYELDTGDPIPDELSALHSCDNPPCCNPRHVFPGTQKQNINDMLAKGRGGDCRNFGENHGRAKLTDEQVSEIRQLYESRGHTQAELALLFKIGGSQISRIIQGQSRTGPGPLGSVIYGEHAPHAKLTDADVAEIRRLANTTDTTGYWSERRLSARFKIGSSQVHRIIRDQSRTVLATREVES